MTYFTTSHHMQRPDALAKDELTVTLHTSVDDAGTLPPVVAPMANSAETTVLAEPAFPAYSDVWGDAR